MAAGDRVSDRRGDVRDRALDRTPVALLPARDDRPDAPRPGRGRYRQRPGTGDQHRDRGDRGAPEQRQPALLVGARHMTLAADSPQGVHRLADPGRDQRSREHRLADRQGDEPAGQRRERDQGRRAHTPPSTLLPSLNRPRTPTDPAVLTTSATSTTRREPSLSRVRWMTRSRPRPSCSRIASWGSPTPAISARVSTRRSASSGEFAWTVERAPSWPVLSAISRSSASPPR